MAESTGFTVSLIFLAAVTLAMIVVVLRRPELTASAGGMIFAFFTFFVLPGMALLGGTVQHYKQAKSTEFCVSCHINQPFGESLYIDDRRFLPAVHFQNKRIPADRACYACHSDYTMFGDVDDKIRGCGTSGTTSGGPGRSLSRCTNLSKIRPVSNAMRGRARKRYIRKSAISARAPRRFQVMRDMPQPGA